MTIPGSGLDGQLTLAELDDGTSVVAVADIDKGNALWLLLGSWKIELGDSPAKSGGGGVVDEAEKLETGNVGRIHQSSALDIGEPYWNTHDDLLNWKLELGSRGGLDLAQEHGHELGSGELLLLTQICNLRSDLAIDVDQRGGDVLLLDLYIGIRQRPSDQALQRPDGVLEVRDLLGFGRLAEISGSWSEANKGTIEADILIAVTHT